MKQTISSVAQVHPVLHKSLALTVEDRIGAIMRVRFVGWLELIQGEDLIYDGLLVSGWLAGRHCVSLEG